MPRKQSRASQRARRLQKTTDRHYTALLRGASPSRYVRREPAHVEPARRLASHLRSELGAEGEEAARLVDSAIAWALKDRRLHWRLLEARGMNAFLKRARTTVSEHQSGEVAVHDAPLIQVVHMVLEAAAEEEAAAELVRAAADVLDHLVGSSHLFNSAVQGVRADGWLTAPRMWERVYTTTNPVAVVAAAAMRTLRDAARIPDEDEVTDADCWFMLREAARLASTAAGLAARPAA